MLIKFINLLIFLLFSFSQFSDAKRGSSHFSFPKSNKSYTKKESYEGFGKKSIVNNLPKTKIVNRHGKLTSKGYIFINPYARSK